MLRSKIVGTNYRRKLRVRVYNSVDAAPPRMAMAEIKQRHGRTTQKRRVVVPFEDALQLCEGRSTRAWADAQDGAVANEILSLVWALALQPVCVISYRRRA